ncbi:hypothetical protein ACHAWF_014942 [Thalassiosira exigua]
MGGSSSEMSVEEASCTDTQTKQHQSPVIDEAGASTDKGVAAQEPYSFSADETTHRSFPRKRQTNYAVPLAELPRRGWQKLTDLQPFLVTRSFGTPFLFVLVLAGYLVRLIYQNRKRQKEWRLMSDSQLEKIRLRNSQQTLETEKATEVGHSTETKKAADPTNVIGSDGSTVGETTALRPKQRNCANDAESGALKFDHLRKIRAKQQEQHLVRIKSAQKQHNRKEKKKSQILHSSLDHAAADRALERRRNIMLQEELMLQSSEQGIQNHQRINELEEMERIELLQQQNLEYQNSLQRDQDRDRQLALENEKRLQREEAIMSARRRLVAAGVKCTDFHTNNSDSSKTSGGEVVKVRLLIPRGQRVEVAFCVNHQVGLMYDLSLLILDKENLLCSGEGGNHEVELQNDGISADAGHDDSANPRNNDYNAIREGWKQIFCPFSLASTYPQRTFDNFCNHTLEDCGLNDSALLMIVVDSD